MLFPYFLITGVDSRSKNSIISLKRIVILANGVFKYMLFHRPYQYG